MADPIYRNIVGYSGVLSDEHNETFLRLAEEAIEEHGAGLQISWVGPDGTYSWRGKGIQAAGEPEPLVIFVDDEHQVDLTGASEEWILLVNAVLRKIDRYSSELSGIGYGAGGEAGGALDFFNGDGEY